MQTFVHYFLHLVFPIILAWVFFRSNWKQAYLIMLATMLVDLDHLLADPIFQANRCSIHYHPLHTYYAIIVYFIMLFVKSPIRIIGVGLLFHMFTDLVDCMMMYAECASCFTDSPAYPVLQWLGSLLRI